MTEGVNGKTLLSEFKFYSGNYSKFLKDLGRYENWDEAVDRVMNMHRIKYADKLDLLEPYLQEVTEAYKQQYLLGSQRALQFGFADSNQGILKHNSKMYNCLSSYADRPAFFQEAMYWLLSGCGIGFRIFPKDVEKYKNLSLRGLGVKTFIIEDSIEGWSDAIGVLISSYLSQEYDVPFPEYQGYRVDFDYSLIRKKGALISGGFKAPGSDGLRASILKIEALLDTCILEYGQLRTIDVYDIVMHMSDAVLSGGVRRSATICLFSKEDNLLVNAKTGNWYVENPQRARSNNSVLLKRDEISKEEFDIIFKSVQDWGEPGFIFTDDYDITYNPCVEIGKYPQTETGVSGWQGCNLTEINGSKCTTPEEFYKACRASAIMGTLQAEYTDFDYVEKTSPAKEIFEREALLGCSITGFTNNPAILFNPVILEKGAEVLKYVNKEVADIIGINQAARLGCVKPSGNASVLLKTASGIHGEHSKRYFRNVQVNKDEDLAKVLLYTNPVMFAESVWSANKTDWVVSFPVENSEYNLYKDDLLGINLLEKVKLVQEFWVEKSTNYELCLNPKARHNVSNTINVIDWEETRDYIYENRNWFAGISLLGNSGDKDFNQAPFTSVLNSEEILNKYGEGSMFASGLIVDALHAFNDNLWQACDSVLFNTPFEENSTTVLKKDWVRRFKKFANNYLEGDWQKTSYLLKDVYLWHKWNKIKQNLHSIDWSNTGVQPQFTEINTTGALACSGGACELVF
jgi:ribonucleoside-triphosphate reductase (thioredoxin)